MMRRHHYIKIGSHGIYFSFWIYICIKTSYTSCIMIILFLYSKWSYLKNRLALVNISLLFLFWCAAKKYEYHMCTVSTKTLSTASLGKFFWLHPQIARDDHQGPNYYLAILHFMLSLMFRKKKTIKKENFRFGTTVLSVTVWGLMKSQMPVNCLDRSSLLWNCMVLVLMLLVFLGELIRF